MGVITENASAGWYECIGIIVEINFYQRDHLKSSSLSLQPLEYADISYRSAYKTSIIKTTNEIKV